MLFAGSVTAVTVAPATVHAFVSSAASASTASLKVNSIVFNAVLTAVKVGGTLSTAFADPPLRTSLPAMSITSPLAATYVTAGVPSVAVRPVVVRVIEVSEVTAVLLTITSAPATVHASVSADALTSSLRVKTIVFSAVLTADTRNGSFVSIT